MCVGEVCRYWQLRLVRQCLSFTLFPLKTKMQKRKLYAQVEKTVLWDSPCLNLCMQHQEDKMMPSCLFDQ